MCTINVLDKKTISKVRFVSVRRIVSARKLVFTVCRAYTYSIHALYKLIRNRDYTMPYNAALSNDEMEHGKSEQRENE